MKVPVFSEDPAFKALRAGDSKAFAQAAAGRDAIDLSGTNLRGVNFSKIDLSKLVLRDAFLRDTDFAGCDLRHLDLSGVSLHRAKIGGTYFPDNIPACEIRMSLKHGTRIRTRPVPKAE